MSQTLKEFINTVSLYEGLDIVITDHIGSMERQLDIFNIETKDDIEIVRDEIIEKYGGAEIYYYYHIPHDIFNDEFYIDIHGGYAL